jgi:hypothetical protein
MRRRQQRRLTRSKPSRPHSSLLHWLRRPSRSRPCQRRSSHRMECTMNHSTCIRQDSCPPRLPHTWFRSRRCRHRNCPPRYYSRGSRRRDNSRYWCNRTRMRPRRRTPYCSRTRSRRYIRSCSRTRFRRYIRCCSRTRFRRYIRCCSRTRFRRYIRCCSRTRFHRHTRCCRRCRRSRCSQCCSLRCRTLHSHRSPSQRMYRRYLPSQHRRSAPTQSVGGTKKVQARRAPAPWRTTRPRSRGHEPASMYA